MRLGRCYPQTWAIERFREALADDTRSALDTGRRPANGSALSDCDENCRNGEMTLRVLAVKNTARTKLDTPRWSNLESPSKRQTCSFVCSNFSATDPQPWRGVGRTGVDHEFKNQSGISCSLPDVPDAWRASRRAFQCSGASGQGAGHRHRRERRRAGRRQRHLAQRQYWCRSESRWQTKRGGTSSIS